MWLSAHVLRTVKPVKAGRIWAGLVGLISFVAVEAVAEACRRHLAVATDFGLGRAAAPLQASFTTLWAYVAHQRLAFRGREPVGRLAGAGIFIVISLAGLDSELLMLRFTPSLQPCVLVFATVLKYVLVRRLVWPTRPTVPERRLERDAPDGGAGQW